MQDRCRWRIDGDFHQNQGDFQELLAVKALCQMT